MSEDFAFFSDEFDLGLHKELLAGFKTVGAMGDRLSREQEAQAQLLADEKAALDAQSAAFWDAFGDAPIPEGHPNYRLLTLARDAARLQREHVQLSGRHAAAGAELKRLFDKLAANPLLPAAAKDGRSWLPSPSKRLPQT